MIGSPLLIAGMLLAGPAEPQVSYKRPKVDTLAVTIMAGFARCAADRDPTGARALLAADYHTPEYDRTLRAFALSHRGCLVGGQLRFNPLLLAGGMAEELMRRDGVTADKLESAAKADTADTFERCVIREKSRDVAALFGTPPASAAENEAFARLQPAYPGCLQRGRTMVANTIGLRARLALATYRLFNGPFGAGTEG